MNTVTVNGVELTIKRVRKYQFLAWQTESGEFVQADNDRRNLWREKGIAFVKVTTVNMTVAGTIPGTDGAKDIVRQKIEGTREHCDKYLTRTPSLSVKYTDEGCETEWTY